MLFLLFLSDRLQGLLKFLEEQSTPEHPWQWKVHCKSQKKLKELGRSVQGGGANRFIILFTNCEPWDKYPKSTFVAPPTLPLEG